MRDSNEKGCKNLNDIKNSECETIDSKMMLQLIKQNEDFKTLMLEQNNKIMDLYESIKILRIN